MELLGILHHWFIHASISEVVSVVCLGGAVLSAIFIGE